MFLVCGCSRSESAVCLGDHNMRLVGAGRRLYYRPIAREEGTTEVVIFFVSRENPPHRACKRRQKRGVLFFCTRLTACRLVLYVENGGKPFYMLSHTQGSLCFGCEVCIAFWLRSVYCRDRRASLPPCCPFSADTVVCLTVYRLPERIFRA